MIILQWHFDLETYSVYCQSNDRLTSNKVVSIKAECDMNLFSLTSTERSSERKQEKRSLKRQITKMNIQIITSSIKLTPSYISSLSELKIFFIDKSSL